MKSASQQDGFRVVGLGASAGGLEALTQFLGELQPGARLACLVVQHLDPTQDTELVALLQRTCALPVRSAAGAGRLRADTVYVIDPGAELMVHDGELKQQAPQEPRGQRLPIDVLFRSLAHDYGAAAIGVVLSGMGFDGTAGLEAIRMAGGMTLVQQPDTARFRSMPASAVAAGRCDAVATPDQLAQYVLAHVTMPHPEEPGPIITRITQQLRERGRHDLSLYKPSTLRRRCERRMHVHGLADLHAYAAFLRDNPAELELLSKEMLIGVTGFFRDPAAWQSLEAIWARRPKAPRTPAQPWRIWVAGCSTGEEACSMAMVIDEWLDTHASGVNHRVQIFATDLSADAIAVARRGYYSRSAVAGVSAARLQRHFAPEGDGYRICPRIREMILFTVHNVILDPPFTRLDLLSCRNLMIYFTAPLQARLLPLFHYALKPGALLLLGESETVGKPGDLFTPLDAPHRIYQRNEAPGAAGSVDFPVHTRAPARAAPESKASAPMTNLQSLAEALLLRHFAPSAVLVNEQGDILYVSGRTGRYLEPAAGRANWNVHVMAHADFRTQLAVGLRRAMRDATRVELPGLMMGGGSASLLDILIEPLQQPDALAGMAMIVFREVAQASPRGTADTSAAPESQPELAAELARSQEELLALREEMRAAAEELQATNEELQSANEELQSANEELTTSKEESQSMNEELQTINAELRAKLDDLALAQSDMHNLLNSTEIATLFLDPQLNVRRFTEHMTRIVHLRDSDIGRPLSELANTLIYPQLHQDAQQTLRTLASSEKQIATTDGHWLNVRIMPYRTVADVIQGVVITFIDITAAKQLEQRLRAADTAAGPTEAIP